MHRVVAPTDDETPGLDPDEPVHLSLHGEWSEQRGYARSMPDGSLETLVLEDRYVSELMKADSAEVYAYRSMAFDEPPALRARPTCSATRWAAKRACSSRSVIRKGFESSL